MKRVLIIAVTIVAVVALGNVLLASAQGGRPTVGGQPPFSQNAACPVSGARSGAYTCPFTGTMPYGVPGGMMGGRGMMGMHGVMMGANGMHVQVWTAVATKLGMTYAELNTATQNGQTVAQLAQAKGVALEDLKDVAEDAIKASFADLVRQGVMTQEQVDWMADHLDDMPMFNFEQGFGPGMMNGRVPGGMMNGRVPGRMMRGYQPPSGPQG